MSVLVLVVLSGALAASVPQSADDRELAQYRLTTEILAKVEAVAKAFEANLAKTPKAKKLLDAQRELAELDKKETLTPAEQKRAYELQSILDDEPEAPGIEGGSLSEISAQLMRIPAMAAALKSAGMPAREMAKYTVTVIQAAMADATGQAVPPGAAGDNVRFVKANQAAIERLNRVLGAR